MGEKSPFLDVIAKSRRLREESRTVRERVAATKWKTRALIDYLAEQMEPHNAEPPQR